MPASSPAVDVGVRDRILAAAVELFAAGGYDATSVAQVVGRAGVTKGALYHYFQAKEDLLFEIYHSLLAHQLASLDAIVARGLEPADTLAEIISSLVQTTAANAKAVTVFTRDSARVNEERWRTLRDEWRRYQDTVRGIIRDAQRRRIFADDASPEVISWAIFGMSNSMPTWFRADGPKRAADIAAELTAFVLAALDPARPAAGGHDPHHP